MPYYQEGHIEMFCEGGEVQNHFESLPIFIYWTSTSKWTGLQNQISDSSSFH
jgi:hypothetical protein